MEPLIEKNAVVLFQGDSITDAGRNREVSGDLGMGYPMLAAGWFSAMYPELNVTFLNRGISGNTVKDLQGRWQEDTLDLKPTWLSIMIGINDTWWAGIGAEEFETIYRDILTRAKETLNPRLVLIEPYIMPANEEYARVRGELNPKIEVVRQLAREYEAMLIPMDGLFAQACAKQPAQLWTPDGVHLFPAGNALVAQAWLRAVKAL